VLYAQYSVKRTQKCGALSWTLSWSDRTRAVSTALDDSTGYRVISGQVQRACSISAFAESITLSILKTRSVHKRKG